MRTLLDLESVSCEACGGYEAEVLYQKPDKFKIYEELFSVVRCSNCSLTFVNPRPVPEGMGQFYPETYSWKELEKTASDPLGWVGKIEKFYRGHQLRSETKRLQQHLPNFGGKVLDIGCGIGDRLDLFRRLGCDPYGVETSEQALYAQNVYKLDVFHGPLAQASFEADSMDIVTLYNVLEHVHRPKEN